MNSVSMVCRPVAEKDLEGQDSEPGHKHVATEVVGPSQKQHRSCGKAHTGHPAAGCLLRRASSPVSSYHHRGPYAAGSLRRWPMVCIQSHEGLLLTMGKILFLNKADHDHGQGSHNCETTRESQFCALIDRCAKKVPGSSASYGAVPKAGRAQQPGAYLWHAQCRKMPRTHAQTPAGQAAL